MNLKKIFFLGLIAINIIVIINSLQHLNNTNKPIIIHSTIVQDSLKLISQEYTNWLIQEEASLWSELAKTIKLSQNYFSQLKKQWYKDYQHEEKILLKEETSQRPLSQKTYELVTSILSDFNLSNRQISIKPWKDDSAAAATDTTLFINEKCFNQLQHEAQKFVIGHELQHFLHKDSSTNYVLRRHYKKNTPSDAKDHPLNKFARFHELRADIQSALHGPDYAKGYVLYLETLKDNIGITHPKNSLRLAIGRKILNNNLA